MHLFDGDGNSHDSKSCLTQEKMSQDMKPRTKLSKNAQFFSQFAKHLSAC